MVLAVTPRNAFQNSGAALSQPASPSLEFPTALTQEDGTVFSSDLTCLRGEPYFDAFVFVPRLTVLSLLAQRAQATLHCTPPTSFHIPGSLLLPALGSPFVLVCSLP